MNDLRKAAQQALEALKNTDEYLPVHFDEHFEAIESLKAAIAQERSYVQTESKPLTDDEIELAYREIWRDLSDGFSHTSVEWIEAGIRYAEKAHGIGDEE